MTATANSTLTHVDPKQTREAYTRPLDLQLIIRLFRYMKPHAARRNWLFLLVIVRSIQLPLLALVTAHILSGPIVAASREAAVGGTVSYWGIWRGTALFGILALITQFTMHYRRRLSLELGESVVRDLRRDMFEHLQKLTMSFYDRTMLGRVISRMTGDIEAVRSGVQELFFVALVAGGQMIIAAAIMLWTNVWLFALLLMMVPMQWVIGRYFRPQLSKAHRTTRESFSRVTANLAESVNGIRVTQSFARQDRNASMFGDLVYDHSTHHVTVARLSGIFSPLLDITSQVFTAMLFVGGGYLAMGGHIDLEVLFKFFFLSATFFVGAQSIAGLYLNALAVMAGAERIYRLLDTEPDWADAPDAIELPPIHGLVQFKDVTFGYDPDQPVLHHIKFIAKPGQTIAFVGHTGSGKSSILKLIAKFYQPTSGELLIDGYDIQRIRGDSLHHQMGIVLQQNFLFTGRVMDNIRFAKPDATDEQVIDAARKLDCLDIIESLPDGFNTHVGERGSNLSLGQCQLVCFTRAMLANPRIMILDEATSSVDTMTEARIQHALDILLKGRTSFVVAHRLSTIRHADLVLVLDHGRIVERGTHNELLATGGVYANLYKQFIRSSEG